MCSYKVTAIHFISAPLISFLHIGRTPDSPESVRAVAPRSPISPKAQYTTSLALQRAVANGSTSPIQKGGSTTPPQTSSAASTPQAATPILTDTSKELAKLRKFLGALYQFGQDTSNECGDRVRSLILSLVVSENKLNFIVFETKNHKVNLNFFAVSEWWIIDGSIQASSTGICELSTAAIRVAISQITYSHIEERLSKFSKSQQSGMHAEAKRNARTFFKINQHHLTNTLLCHHYSQFCNTFDRMRPVYLNL